MLDGIKSKLGFAGSNDRGAGQGRYDDAYDDYGDYGEYGEYGEGYEDYGDYGEGYDAGSQGGYGTYAPVTTRAANDRTARSRSRETSAPKLVSYDDVRSHTQLPDNLTRDPLPPRRVTSASRSYRGERTMVDSSLPRSLTPEGAAATAAAASGKARSEGLNSLFEPSEGGEEHDRRPSRFASGGDTVAPSSYRASAPAADVRASSASGAAARSGFDPYEAYAGTGSTSFSSSRACSVLKPASYAEVERIAKILKAGDAVVLALRNTPDPLAKRILDFSFGVSSALEANVECVADKVFAITRGNALTDAERVSLRSQGVL